MIVNKKGWMRIVEATLAALIVLSVLFVMYTKNTTSSPPDLSAQARMILEEIGANSTLRNHVLSNNPDPINQMIAQRLTGSLLFEISICGVRDVCGKSTYTPGDIYSAERVISATVEHPTFAPKKVRIFIWRK